jgi:hypothetical protein
MKRFTQTLTTAFIAILLLSFGAANAQTVHFDDPAAPEKATSITGLILNGTNYDIIFDYTEAAIVYGDYTAPTFTFDNETDAGEAAIAMITELESAGAAKIGQVNGQPGTQTFCIGFDTLMIGLQHCAWEGGTRATGAWLQAVATDPRLWNGDPCNWAIFTITTGINEELSGVSVNVYPNPATDVLNVEASNGFQQVTLINITGQVVRNIELEAGKTSIDLNGLRNGVYFVRIETEKGITTRKVVIQ